MIKKQLWLILLCIPFLCAAQIEKYSVKYEQVVLTPEHEQFHSPEVDLYFDSIRQIFNAEMHEVIGHTDQLLPLKDGALPGSLCHFITDVLFDFCDSIVKSENGSHIDMAVLNIGGIRDDMVAGNVTKGNIFSS